MSNSDNLPGIDPSSSDDLASEGAATVRPGPDPERLREFDEAAARFDAANRWQDLIRTLQQKAELVVDAAERVALVEHLRREVPPLSATARQAVDGYLARTLAYDYWDAGLVDSGLQLYEGLPIDLQRYVRSDEVPETVTFGGFSRTLDRISCHKRQTGCGG